MHLDDSQMDWASRHEIGHALAGWIYGEKIRFITMVGPEIKIDHSDQKSTCYVTFDYGERTPTDATVQAHTAHALMPLVIEELEEKEIVSWHDAKVITDRLGHSCVKNGSRQMVDYCHQNYDDPDLPKKFYRKFKESAAAIYSDPRAKKILDIVGKKLRKEGSIGGQEAARIFEKVWGCLPEKALPFEKHSPSFNPKTEVLSLAVGKIDAKIYLDKAIESIRDSECQDEAEEQEQEGLLKSLLQAKFQTGL